MVMTCPAAAVELAGGGVEDMEGGEEAKQARCGKRARQRVLGDGASCRGQGRMQVRLSNGPASSWRLARPTA